MDIITNANKFLKFDLGVVPYPSNLKVLHIRSLTIGTTEYQPAKCGAADYVVPTGKTFKAVGVYFKVKTNASDGNLYIGEADVVFPASTTAPTGYTSKQNLAFFKSDDIELSLPIEFEVAADKYIGAYVSNCTQFNLYLFGYEV